MTLSDRIRAAALGPTPDGRHCCDWVGRQTEEHEACRDWLAANLRHGFRDFWYANRSIQRMALLFVAEAVK